MLSFRSIRYPLSLSALVAAQAFAQEAAAPTGAAPDPVKGLLVNMPIFLALFGLFYFGIIRPQRNQQKKHQEFLVTLKKGDEIVTASGLIGRIAGMTDRVVSLEIAEGTEIKVLRSQVQSLLKEVVGNG